MPTRPEALRLADLLESCPLAVGDAQQAVAAAELRRLHQFSEDQIGRATAAEAALQMTKATHALKIAAVETQRDALLEAYRKMKNVAAGYSNLCDGSAFTRKLEREFEAADAIARAAIKAVEEGK